MSKTIAAFYQTPDELTAQADYTHYYVSAFHFGFDDKGEPYIHWNDHVPDDPCFDEPWAQLEQLATAHGKTVTLMLGGAGSAFTLLFEHFDLFYPLLKQTLSRRPFLTGTNLDIEETVTLDNVCTLVDSLKRDFGKDFIITMAPVAGSLAYDTPGMGGFVYKDLMSRPQGALIDWFNVQCYGANWCTYMIDKIVRNGYPADKLVMGMLWNDFPDLPSLVAGMAILRGVNTEHPTLRGAYIWQHANAPMGPERWAALASQALKQPLSIDMPTKLKPGHRTAIRLSSTQSPAPKTHAKQLAREASEKVKNALMARPIQKPQSQKSATKKKTEDFVVVVSHEKQQQPTKEGWSCAVQ